MINGMVLRRAVGRSVGRLPLAREAYWSAKALFGRERAYAGRWDMLAECLADLDQVVGPSAPIPGRRIMMFASLPEWVDVCIPIAAVLAERAVVDLFWLPHGSYFPAPSDRYQRWSYARPGPTPHPRVRVIDLSKASRVPISRQTETLVEGLSRRDAVYAGFRETWDLDSDPDGRAMYEFRLARNRDCAEAIAGLLDQANYDLAVIPNGAILEFAVAYEMARVRNIPTVTFENFELRDTIIAIQNQLVTYYPTDHLWAEDAPHIVNADREQRVARLMAKRETPNWQDEFIWAGQSAERRDAAALAAELGIDTDRPTALMCTNLAWDSAVIGRSAIFRSMAEWIQETVAWFSAHPDYQLIVRCHPAEQHWPTNEPTEGVIKARMQELPSNIRLIRPTDKVNTYGLMPLARFGIVFTSTVGLEMACRGMPTVVAGLVHYRGKGFTTEPATPNEYFEELRLALANPVQPARSQTRSAELARSYLDVLYHRWPMPYPWAMDPRDKLRVWPVRRVLSPEGRAQYGRTFDILSGVDRDS